MNKMPQNCRNCLQPIDDPSFSLINTFVGKMFESLTSLKVAADDIHSTVVCDSCISRIPLDYDAQQAKISEMRNQLQNQMVDYSEIAPHLPYHYMKTQSVCGICEESFPNRFVRRTHMKEEHKVAPERLKCRNCKKKFWRGLGFGQEPIISEAKKKHLCLICVSKSHKYN